MAGKTYTQKIQFKGSFDGAEVLANLKKIRQSMSDAGANASLFKGVFGQVRRRTRHDFYAYRRK